MPSVEPDRLLELLRDPNVESLEIARVAGVPREEAGRAARLLAGLAKAKPEDVASLPAPLAAALGRAAATAGRLDVLVALAGHAAKDVAKEAKRGLHVLRTRGVAVPDLPAPAAPAPAPAPAEPPLPAFASAPDGRGERGVWLARNVPGKGIEVAQAVVSDAQGLVALQVGLLGRKEWRTFSSGLVERGASMAVIELPPARARALVEQARATSERTGARVPEGADLWLAKLGPAPAAADDPAVPELSPLPAEEERAAVADSAKLHALPLVSAWLADPEHLRATAARLDEIAVSKLYVDERQRAEQAERVVSDAAEAWLTPEVRARVAARLEVLARHLAARGDGAHARLAAASARALLSGVPASALPFARLLVEKAFPPGGDGAAPARIDPAAPLR